MNTIQIQFQRIKTQIRSCITSIKHSMVLINILKIILCSIAAVAILLFAHLFEKKGGFLLGLTYFSLFTVCPIVIFILFHKNKGIRWHILVCAIIVVFASAKIYTNPDNYISYDIDTYLSGDSDFVDSASMVMPSKDMVSESSVAFYEHHDYGDMGNRLYRLSVIYDDEDFLSEKNRLEKQLAEHTGYREQEKDNFYLDGCLYTCFVFVEDGYYAMAYHLCQETNTISYLFLEDDINLPSMTAGDAFKSKLGDEHVKIIG